MKRQHKHAALIQQWLDDGSLEVEGKNGLGKWVTVCNDQVNWNEAYEYRFKPKMVKCGDLEFPEPMRVAPEARNEFYMPCCTSQRQVVGAIWIGDKNDLMALARGLAHSTQAAAEAHARALIALTEVK